MFQFIKQKTLTGLYALVQLYHIQGVLEDIFKILKFVIRRRKQSEKYNLS